MFTRTNPERNAVERIRKLRTTAHEVWADINWRPLCSDDMTLEDMAIVNDLGHVAFMAWLAEISSRREIAYFRALAENRATLGGTSHTSMAFGYYLTTTAEEI